MLIHLAIGWAVLRYLIASRVPPEEAEEARGAPWWRQYALAGAAAVLAVLFPVVVALSPHRPDLSGKKIVFLKQGVMNFLKPTYGEGPSNYGWISVGMYGMLPTYLEMYGATTLVSPDVSASDLEGANVLVVILRDIKSGPWSKGFPEAVRRFVENGGTLLVLADHTMEPVDEKGKLDEKGTEGELPPFRYLNNYINQLLEPTSIRVLFDSAELVLPGWLHSYDAISHPSSAGVKERGNQFGVVTGASVDPSWPAYPLLIGRFGWNDWGQIDAPPERALLGNRAYDEGEKLGDCILAAEQPYGEGRVVVFGDTTSFINPNLAGAHHYLSRLFAYLADPASTPQDAWRQVAGLLLGIALLVVLLVRATAGAMGPGRRGRGRFPGGLHRSDPLRVDSSARRQPEDAQQPGLHRRLPPGRLQPRPVEAGRNPGPGADAHAQRLRAAVLDGDHAGAAQERPSADFHRPGQGVLAGRAEGHRGLDR